MTAREKGHVRIGVHTNNAFSVEHCVINGCDTGTELCLFDCHNLCKEFFGFKC